MALKFERQLPLILSAVFILITAIGFVFFQNTANYQEAKNVEKRSMTVLGKMDETLRLTLDIESGSRRFIVIGNETYLQPFNTAKQKLGPSIAQLRTLTAGNPVQTAELDRLEPIVNEYVKEATENVAERKMNGFGSATTELVANRNEMVLSDQIRASIERLKAEELRVLQEKESQLDRNLYFAIWTFIIGSLAGIAALIIANFVVSREIGKRRTAEDALIGANKDLEKRIDERTSELQTVNSRLRETSSERETLLASEQNARKEAEIANRLRDEFMATVSHELRTPINAILGWSRLMKAGKLNGDQTVKAVDTIIKNSETQNRLIKDLMDVARVVSGKLDLQMGDIKPAEIVSIATESIRPSAERKNIAVEMNIDDEVRRETIRGDKTRLLQVFSNILTNAVKFTPESGAINVAAKRSNGHIEIEVADTGIGISPEFLPLVFERFRQDTESKRKSGGLGLGLAIVRNLVEQHGGSVRVASEGENKGATFVVALPVESTN